LRFTRKKHDFNFPKRAADYCLREAGIHREDLDYVVFYDKPLLKFERLLETYLAFGRAGKYGCDAYEARSFNTVGSCIHGIEGK